MRARPITTPPAAGSAPPLRPVPAPRLTNGILWRAQTRTTACTSSALRGSTTAPGSDAEVGQPVALIGLQLALAGDQTLGADSGAELVYGYLGKHSA